ncbi:MAG TPA: transporter [Micropepsaceae bacterium]|nr:transporter [Micropepsaceae bacterium]
MHRRHAVCAVVAGLFVAPPALAQTLPAPSLTFPQIASGEEFSWGLSGGFDYATGKLGANCGVQNLSITCTPSATTVFVVPVTGMVQVDRLRLEMTVPWVDIQGPGRFAGVFGVPVVIAPANNQPAHRSGIGDITVGAAFAVIREDDFLPRVEIEGVSKLPTAADGLGTGKTDYGAQVNLFKTFFPGLTTFGSLGYEWIGEINTVALHSGARATAGAEYRFLSVTAGGVFDYRQNSWQGAPDYFAFDPYARLAIFPGISVGIYATLGMTRSTPSSGFGFRVSI